MACTRRALIPSPRASATTVSGCARDLPLTMRLMVPLSLPATRAAASKRMSRLTNTALSVGTSLGVGIYNLESMNDMISLLIRRFSCRRAGAQRISLWIHGYPLRITISSCETET
jgi:hypothetical protein